MNLPSDRLVAEIEPIIEKYTSSMTPGEIMTVLSFMTAWVACRSQNVSRDVLVEDVSKIVGEAFDTYVSMIIEDWGAKQ